MAEHMKSTNRIFQKQLVFQFRCILKGVDLVVTLSIENRNFHKLRANRLIKAARANRYP